MSDRNESEIESELSEHRGLITELCLRAFDDRSRWPEPPSVAAIEDVNQGRGAFSVVARVALQWPGGASKAELEPAAVVAKLPVDGPNGQAAIDSGAYRREALAYRELLVEPLADRRTVLATPEIYLVDEPGDGTTSLIMEDLSPQRAVDQLDGLAPSDAVLVATGLAEFHRSWANSDRLDGLEVRRNTIAGLAPEALKAGLAALETTWAAVVTDQQRAAYARLVEAQPQLVDAFATQPPTLCHGDPRADNLVFAGRAGSHHADTVVLFDWQQMAVQFGEADVAWLSATSLDVDVRRRTDHRLVEAYGGSFDRYRLGLALPGLTVMLLAQRQAENERTRRFIATSLQRIAAAIDDLDVAASV